MENIERPVEVSKAQKQVMTSKNQQSYDEDQFTKIYDYLDGLNGEIAGSLNVDKVYPVGSIYMTVNNVNPATLFGGEWQQIKDRFLLSAGNTYTAGNTGGSATKNISHNHKLKTNINKNSGNGNGIAFTAGSVIFENNNAEAVQSGGSTTQDIMPPYLVVYVWKRTA